VNEASAVKLRVTHYQTRQRTVPTDVVRERSACCEYWADACTRHLSLLQQCLFQWRINANRLSEWLLAA
jgi:hypothetical protein